MLTIIKNGEVYSPGYLGQTSILLGAEKILRIGAIDEDALIALGLPFTVIDAAGCYVVPGFIDPHQHLLGGSGEKGFASQTPEIYPSEIIKAGITTVVGCLGVDTVMKTMAGLLAKVKALKEEGLNANLWTGGYDANPASITSSARNDIMFIEEVIGLGELAISDERSTCYDLNKLATLVVDARNGGMLAANAGVTHFHVGEGDAKLQMLRDLIEKFPIEPEWIYPTHITRSESLMLEAIDLAKRGSYVDMDTVNKDLARWFAFYTDNGGRLDRLTISTDSSITSPQHMIDEVRSCVLEHNVPLETILPCVTSNTAKVLGLDKVKGQLIEGYFADVTILGREQLDVRYVISRGKTRLAGGELAFTEAFLSESDRDILLQGAKLNH